MNTVDIRGYEMFVRVRGFGQDARGLFPPDTLGGRTFAEVTDVIGVIDRNAATLASGAAQEAVSARAAAREALQKNLAGFSRTARALALDTPGLDEKFRIPVSQRDQALINAARAFTANAEPLAAMFIAHEMPADFLETLNRNIAELERAINAKTAGRSAQASANAAIEEAMARGLSAVRRLDGIVANKLCDALPQLAAWKIARHIERKATRSKAAADAVPPVQAAA